MRNVPDTKAFIIGNINDDTARIKFAKNTGPAVRHFLQ